MIIYHHYQGQCLRENVVSDVVASDGQCLQVDRVPVLEGHLDSLEVGVHGHVDSSDGAVHLGSVLQLDCHRLVTEFHQKSHQLHSELCFTI